MATFSFEYLKTLPKAELHCHLDGSLRVDTILELAQKENIKLPKTTHDELKNYLEVGDDCKDLVDYLKGFSVTCAVMQTAEALTRITYELCEDVVAENVQYLEIRFSPLLHTENGLSLAEVIEAVLKGKEKAEQNFNIKVGIIISSIRSFSPEKSLELAKVAVNYKNKGVVAFDLAGPEMDFPAKKHLDAFYQTINNNLNITIHAGEAYGSESIHQSIHYASANRIGHGTRLYEDEDLLNYINDMRIPLEMCVLCNVQTNAVASVADHPIKSYLDKGIRVTINTDNRLISGTTLTKEYKAIADAFDLTKEELKRLIINGFKSAFIPYAEKKALLNSVEKELAGLGL